MTRFLALGALAGCLTLALTSPATAAVSESNFWLDGNGRVFDISSYGHIRIDGRRTNWRPEQSPLDLLVTRGGDAIYTNSFGKLSRNGVNLRQSFIRERYFKVDGDGNIYTVKDHAGERILRNGSRTRYEIADGSGFAVSPGGRIAYTDRRRGTLHINGRDTGIRFRAQDFHVTDRGDVLFVTHRPRNGQRWLLFHLDTVTGERRLLSTLALRDSWTFDLRGRLWFADGLGRIFRGGRDTGYRSRSFGLDGAGNCYFLGRNWSVWRNGQDLGLRAAGGFKVSEAGNVYHLPRRNDGDLYRDGRSLGLRINTRGLNSVQTD